MLTPRQHKVFLFVMEYILQHQGVRPSLREIMAATGMKSTAGAHGILHRLENRGFLKVTKGMARSIIITKKGKDYFNVSANPT